MRKHETDPKEIMRNCGLLTAEVASVVTPIRLLMRSAADSDPTMAALLAESDAERLERMRHNARFLNEQGHLRKGITLAEATDVLWTCSSAELYELLVHPGIVRRNRQRSGCAHHPHESETQVTVEGDLGFRFRARPRRGQWTTS